MNQEYSIIDIGRQYVLSIPKSFKISSGTGDDTDYVQIYTEDGSIYLGYESAVRNNLHRIDAKYLEENFEKVELLKNSENEEFWIAYSSIDTRLRDIKGAVFIEKNKSLKELISFSCSSSKLNQVRKLVSSVEKK